MSHEGAEAVFKIIDTADEQKPEPPRPLIRELPPADPFPVDALGDLLGSAAKAIRERVNCPIAICGQSVLAAATVAAQGHADIELPTGHVKPCSSFFVTIAETGERKTAADNEALWPVWKREKALREACDKTLPDYLNQKIAWDKEGGGLSGACRRRRPPGEFSALSWRLYIADRPIYQGPPTAE